MAGKKDTTLTALLKKQANISDKRISKPEESESSSKLPQIRSAGTAPMFWFSSPLLPKNSFFSVYKAIFTNSELADESNILEAIKKRQLENVDMAKEKQKGLAQQLAYKGPHIFLCMIGGGHFAAMVIALAPRHSKGHTGKSTSREATAIAHKTFHRYTTRRKQGGSQSTNDNSKGTAHSAGSSLRRYNEQALVEDVRSLLQDWKGLIDTSDLLFVRATGTTNRRTLFGPYDGQVLQGNDPRLRNFPFTTKRATQNELLRAFGELTKLRIREIDPAQAAKAKPQPSSSASQAPKAAPKESISEEEKLANLHTSQLQANIRRSKLPALLAYMKDNKLDASFNFLPEERHAPTPIHFAASQNAPAIVTGLLLRAGADPTPKNKDGKTPFELAGDRATRDAFRMARSELGEHAWDWEAAGVPAPLSRQEVEKRAGREKAELESKESERRRAAEEKIRLEEEKLRKEGGGRSGGGKSGGLYLGVQKTPQQKREDEVRGMTPEMRARLDRERRARAAEERLKRQQE